MQLRFKFLMYGQWSDWFDEEEAWILRHLKVDSVEIVETMTREEFEKSKHYENLLR